MTELKTNRDLYLSVLDIIKEHGESGISLEEYLIALRECGSRWQHLNSIPLNDFCMLLREAFTNGSVPYNETWTNQYQVHTEQSGYTGWLTTITSQIVDLHEMRLAGVFQNDMRYFGIMSPRKGYWVNFDPGSFLECAITGSLGGWQPDDDSGRSYVPGPVAVLDESGNLVTMDPKDVPNPIYELPEVTWDIFKDILQSGQMYE